MGIVPRGSSSALSPGPVQPQHRREAGDRGGEHVPTGPEKNQTSARVPLRVLQEAGPGIEPAAASPAPTRARKIHAHSQRGRGRGTRRRRARTLGHTRGLVCLRTVTDAFEAHARAHTRTGRARRPAPSAPETVKSPKAKQGPRRGSRADVPKCMQQSAQEGPLEQPLGGLVTPSYTIPARGTSETEK